MNTLGERLKELREKRGWTKTYVANRIGIKTLSTYANYEYGLREPDNETLMRLADLYEISMDSILGRDERKSPSLSDEADFDKWVNNPEVYKFYKEFNESPEERRQALLAVWEILKNQKKWIIFDFPLNLKSAFPKSGF